MADNFGGDRFSLTAGGAINVGAFVKFSAGKVIACTAVSDRPVGVAMHSAAADGDPVSVKILGPLALARVDGDGSAVAIGDSLMPKATGAGDLVKLGATTGDREVAIALEASTTADSSIVVALTDGRYTVP